MATSGSANAQSSSPVEVLADRRCGPKVEVRPWVCSGQEFRYLSGRTAVEVAAHCAEAREHT